MGTRPGEPARRWQPGAPGQARGPPREQPARASGCNPPAPGKGERRWLWSAAGAGGTGAEGSAQAPQEPDRQRWHPQGRHHWVAGGIRSTRPFCSWARRVFAPDVPGA